MKYVLDHVFICTAAGAPAAEKLREFGLTEGSPNKHPGQGTACRRFFFKNAMLELLWVKDAAEAQSEQTRRTKLWDRWTAAGRAASPFGIILRPASRPPEACPFKAWEYRPESMPDLVLQIADAGMEEPMWCYMESGRAPAEWPLERRQPMEHSRGLREITGVHLVCPPLSETSVTRAMADLEMISLEVGAEHLMEIEFDGRKEISQADFRPELPLVLRW